MFFTRSDISFTKRLSYPLQFHVEVHHYGMMLLQLYKATGVICQVTCAGEPFFRVSCVLTAEKFS
jgi:hypothetical protein